MISIDATAAFFIAHLVRALIIIPIEIKKSVIYMHRFRWRTSGFHDRSNKRHCSRTISPGSLSSLNPTNFECLRCASGVYWVNSICATTAASAIRNASFPRGLTPIEFVSSLVLGKRASRDFQTFEPSAKPHDGAEAQASPDLSGVNRRYLGTAAKGGIFHYYSSASYLEAGRQVARGGSSIRINRKVQFWPNSGRNFDTV